MNWSFSWILTVLVGLVTFLLVKWYMRIRSLPPGPFPLPFVGNILKLRGKEVIAQEVMRNYGKKYNDIFTFWMGPSPSVIITSWDLCKEGLITKKNDFSGRVIRDSSDLFLDGGHDVISSDYGPCWETLRKVFASAVRKFAVSEKLSNLVGDIVDRSVESMLKEGKPIDCSNYAYLIVYNILASSAFGQRYEMDDPEFVALRKGSKDTFELIQKVSPSLVVPLLVPFYRKHLKELKEVLGAFHGFTNKKYNEHKMSYQKVKKPLLVKSTLIQVEVGSVQVLFKTSLMHYCLQRKKQRRRARIPENI